MSLETLFSQPTRKPPSAPMRETFIALRLLPACCACGLVLDETGATPGRKRWVKQRRYQMIHGVKPTELALTHTYCPNCFTKAQETIRQLFREEEDAAMTQLTGSRRLLSGSRSGPGPSGAGSARECCLRSDRSTGDRRVPCPDSIIR